MKAVLFDLDGTLLDNDVSLFIPKYFALLSKRFSRRISPEKFIDSLIKASNAMISPPHPSLTNEEVFWREFTKLTGMSFNELSPQIEDFYLGEYSTLKEITRPIPEARELLSSLVEKGYIIALATSPIFPEIAIRQRMKWAKIDDLPFQVVTTYENMHSGKPCLEYYQEILKKLGIQPWQALMVGNSLQDDMVSKKVGVFTYLIHSGPLDSLDTSLIDWFGPLSDLKRVLSLYS